MPTKLKDLYFSDVFIEALVRGTRDVFSEFDENKFTRLVYDEAWPERELKDKMRHVTRCLHATLPAFYPAALDILAKVGPLFTGFDAMVFPDYVECYGLDHWELSLPALALFTRLCSSEFAVRPFLQQDPVRGMAQMLAWAGDDNEHVRRLASEGCRPRLPWAMALPAFKKDPGLILPVLEKLKADKSEYVRRSVANNLNDISKDHPELVLDICERWYGRSPETDGIVKHACRGMLKAGNERALALFGFGESQDIGITGLSLNNERPAVGETVQFTFELHVNTGTACRVRLEYKVYYQKAAGRLSPKVFQIKEDTFEPGCYVISRKHSFEDRSIRRHYPGQHDLVIVVNGVEMAKVSLQLTP